MSGDWILPKLYSTEHVQSFDVPDWPPEVMRNYNAPDLMQVYERPRQHQRPLWVVFIA